MNINPEPDLSEIEIIEQYRDDPFSEEGYLYELHYTKEDN